MEDDDVLGFFSEIKQIESSVIQGAATEAQKLPVVQVVVSKPQVIVRAPEIKEPEPTPISTSNTYGAPSDPVIIVFR